MMGASKRIMEMFVNRKSKQIDVSMATFANPVNMMVAKRNLDEMCEDSWRWQSNNPNGYNKEGDNK